MSSVDKVITTKELPKDANIVTRQGKQYVRIKIGGRIVHCPVTECGTRYSRPSAKWYIRYKDEHGKWKKEPGCTDKEATVQLLAERERQVERRKAGLIDPQDDFYSRPLLEHLSEFKAYLLAKEETKQHVDQTHNRIKRLLSGCGFHRWSDIDPDRVITWLAEQRAAKKFRIKTSNYYLAAVKHFVKWIGKRSGENPLAELRPLNTNTENRRQRRALSSDAIPRLIDAAHSGPAIQCVSGVDRAMLYILAIWTGYRCRELASINKRSLNFHGQPATINVPAAYSKRRKKEAIPLHPELVSQLQKWLTTKTDLGPDEPLFNLRRPGGGMRRTAKMMRLDLEAARAIWIDEAKDDPEERKRREDSDYLCYQDQEGMYADFHANRHIFISNLSKAGIGPKMAQSLARHSNVDLTMNTYTHLEMADRATAISGLPAPPSLKLDESASAEGTEKFAHMFAKLPALDDANCHPESQAESAEIDKEADAKKNKPLPEQGFGVESQPVTLADASSGGGTRTPDTRIMIPLL